MFYRRIAKRPLFITGVVASLLLLAFVSINAAILFASLVLTYKILRNYLSASVFDSKFYRLVLAVVSYLVILQLTIMGVWLFNRNFPLDWTIGITGVVILIAYLCERRWGKTTPIADLVVKRFNFNDACSLAIALFILLLILGAPVKQSLSVYHRVDIPAISAQYIDTSLDDSSQLSRINDRLQLNRGVLYKSDAVNYVVHQNTISTYPPSWISANAMVMKAIKPSISVGGQSLVAYVLSKSFWMLILVFCFARVATNLYQLLVRRDKKLMPPDYLWLTGALSFFSYYILLEQFKEGFYEFIPLLISQLLILALLLQLGSEKDPTKKEPFLSSRSFFPLILIFANAVLAWFLVLPAVGIAVLAILVKRQSVKAFFQSVWQPLKAQSLIVLMTVVAVVVQAVVITGDSSRTFREGVNDPGGITFHSHYYLVFTFIGVGLLFGLAAKYAKVLRAIAPYLVCLLGVALFIYLFQVLTIHSPEYYFYKTLNTALIIAVPIAIVGWLLLMRLVSGNYGGLTAVFISIAFVICLPLIIGIDPLNTSNLNYIRGKRGLSLEETKFVYNEMNRQAKTDYRQRSNRDTIFLVSGDVGHNIIAANIVRSVQKVDDCDAKIFLQLLLNKEDEMFNRISDCRDVHHLTIVTKPELFDQVQQKVDSYNLGQSVTVVSVR